MKESKSKMQLRLSISIIRRQKASWGDTIVLVKFPDKISLSATINFHMKMQLDSIYPLANSRIRITITDSF